MNGRLFLYSLWCLGITGAFLAATMYGYSPFADGGRVAPRAGIYGPTHK
ncbi:hypothetical protein [Allosphingosinicella sp.]